VAIALDADTTLTIGVYKSLTIRIISDQQAGNDPQGHRKGKRNWQIK